MVEEIEQYKLVYESIKQDTNNSIVDKDRGNNYSMVRYIRKRIRNNKNFLATITGPTGSGKSWSGLSMAELIDPNFDSSRIIFRARELMKLIREGNLPPGSVILWDEAGIDLSNRNWQSVTNKMLNALLQTFRHRNFILLFTVPYHDFIDSASRKLFHADFETQRINKNKQEVIIKPKLLQYNSNLAKWYRKYLKITENGHVVKIKRWAVPKPSDELIKQYEERKNYFTSSLNTDIDNQLSKLESKETNTISNIGIDMVCSKCEYTWKYKGSPGPQIHCPKCMKFFKNPKMFDTDTTTKEGPTI